LSSVEITMTMRCFIPPESSSGYRSSTARSSPTRSRRRFSSSRTEPNLIFRDSTSSRTIFPILRVGFIALIAYCGTIDTSENRKAFIASVSPIGSWVPSRVTVPPTCRILLSMRMRLLPSVVLPDPDSPTSPMISPSATENVTPSSACTSPRNVR
jgi:hypothetical protein